MRKMEMSNERGKEVRKNRRKKGNKRRKEGRKMKKGQLEEPTDEGKDGGIVKKDR